MEMEDLPDRSPCQPNLAITFDIWFNPGSASIEANKRLLILFDTFAAELVNIASGIYRADSGELTKISAVFQAIAPPVRESSAGSAS